MINFKRVIALVLLGAALMLPELAVAGDGRASVAKPYYTFQRVVYQNDGGWPDDRAYFGRLLRHIGAHIVATDSKVEIRVVNFGAGVKLFVMAKEDAELAKAIDELRSKGVHFLICKNTMQSMKLSTSVGGESRSITYLSEFNKISELNRRAPPHVSGDIRNGDCPVITFLVHEVSKWPPAGSLKERSTHSWRIPSRGSCGMRI